LWIAVLILFLAGAAAGWALSSSSSHTSPSRVHSETRMRDRLGLKVRRLEGEVARARDRRHQPSYAGLDPGSGELTGVTIAIDPGHNGGNASHPEQINRLVPAGANGTTKACNTTGTGTDDGQLTEAQLNFDVAEDLQARLESHGATVVMTRTSNDGVGPCVNERAEIGNEANADAAISIHADGNLSPDAHGFHVIYPATDEMIRPAIADSDKALATLVRNALVAAGIPPANYIGSEGLDERDDLAGLNLSTQPIAMVEMGNMRSATEASKFESPAYRAVLAGALYSALRRFLGGAD
jgi:N-acetylmuramoyl-L-alanine amidase